MDAAYKKLLEKQGYEFCGEHTAVKICDWTRKSLRNEGVCYKEKFYGIIKSHQCCQISPSINYCNMNCIFCWRERNNSPFNTPDNPKSIIEKALSAQKKLLSDFGGNQKADLKKFKESFEPTQFAISLSGEPLAYPKLNQLIKELHKRNKTIFVVTNGQFPERLKNIYPPTQLYLSLDAPDEQLFLQVNRPDSKNGWKRMLQSLKVLRQLNKKTRTAIRITLVKGKNMKYPKKYAELIEKAKPRFVEVKAYMFVGASQQRLDMKNMPLHEEIKRFAKQICRYCSYNISNEQKASRVVLLTQKEK